MQNNKFIIRFFIYIYIYKEKTNSPSCIIKPKCIIITEKL